MKVRYTATAVAEIEEILSHIAADNRSAAAALAVEIQRTVQLIQDNPELGPVVHIGGIRASIVGRFDYRIFYTLASEVVIIRNVRSMKRSRPWEG
jgi:addiction module RelE/StbE family toxin